MNKTTAILGVIIVILLIVILFLLPTNSEEEKEDPVDNSQWKNIQIKDTE